MKVKKQPRVPEEKIWETCVLCGQTVPVRRESHIAERKCYIEGAGQLCGKCFYEVYLE